MNETLQYLPYFSSNYRCKVFKIAAHAIEKNQRVISPAVKNDVSRKLEALDGTKINFVNGTVDSLENGELWVSGRNNVYKFEDYKDGKEVFMQAGYIQAVYRDHYEGKVSNVQFVSVAGDDEKFLVLSDLENPNGPSDLTTSGTRGSSNATMQEGDNLFGRIFSMKTLILMCLLALVVASLATGLVANANWLTSLGRGEL